MEADESSSEDEVFIGEVTEREMNHPLFNSRRRTTVYFPGISRPDANVSVLRESTEDGTLLFSFENMEGSCMESSGGNKSDQGAENSMLKTELSKKETGNMSGRDGCLWLSKQVCLSHGSDMDSGFSSVSDVGSTTSGISSSSLTLQQSDFVQSLNTKQKMCKDERKKEYSCKISSEMESVHFQSPHISVKTPPDNCDFGSYAMEKDAHCSEAFSESTVSASASAAAAAAQTVVHTSTSTLSNLADQSPKCTRSFAPTVPSVVKDFPELLSDKGFISPTTKEYHRMLPLKRKIARRSPSLELRADLPEVKVENKSDVSGEQGRHSPVAPFSDCGDTSDYYSFNIFHASRKLQKLDLGCDQSPEAERSRTLSIQSRKMFAGGDADATPKHLSATPLVLVPETPSDKTSAVGDSSHEAASLKSYERLAEMSLDEDESEIIPSSQKSEKDSPRNTNRGTNFSAAVTAEPEGKNSDNIDSPKAEALCPLPVLKHTESLDHSIPHSPDLFSSPCQKTSAPATSIQGPVLSPRPGSASPCITKPKSALKPLQPIQEDQNQGKRAKYGNLVMRKPMLARRANKENLERDSRSSQACSSLSFVQTHSSSVEEDVRAAMTHINTMINGETRHVLKDLQSSPTLLTHFPPPREATRISWSENLAEEAVVSLSPTKTPLPRRSILQQRPDDFEFPFSKEPPSPIVLTRRRSPKFPRLLSFNS